MVIALLMLLVLMTCYGLSLAVLNSVPPEAVPVRVRVAAKRRR